MRFVLNKSEQNISKTIKRRFLTQAVELEVGEYAGKGPLGGDERCGGIQDPLNTANQLLDGRCCLLQLPLVTL